MTSKDIAPNALTIRIYWLGIYSVAIFASALFFATVIPPFQTPDEFEHYFHARSIAYGQMIPANDGQGFVGGHVRTSDLAFASQFSSLPFKPDQKATAAMLQSPASGSDDLFPVAFPGAAIYPSYAYAAPTIALLVGDMLSMNHRQSFVFARILNAALYVGLAATALWIFPSAAAAFVLALPMALAQAGSISPDAMTVPLFALIGALLLRRTQRNVSTLALCGAAIALLGPIKAPALAFIIPMVAAYYRRAPEQTTITCLAILFVSAVWHFNFVDLGPVTARQSELVSPSDQMMGLLAAPWSVLPIAFETISRFGWFYISGFIGIFGWLDTPLATWFYILILACLAAAWITSLLNYSFAVETRERVRWPVIVSALLAAGATFGSMYLASTEVGLPFVTGVQGRYFLPMVAIVGMAITAWAPVAKLSTPVIAAPFGIALCASVAHVPFTLISRYYLQAGG